LTHKAKKPTFRRLSKFPKESSFMVIIRLARAGAKKRPFYRLIVADARSPRGGRFLENIGTFDPAKDGVFDVKQDRLTYWTSKGARPSPTVTRLLKHAAKSTAAPAKA
jgi:small subunit ribosomal protein S16